jgi:hypothetical protein
LKIKELIERVTEALRGAINGGRLPQPIVFDSITDLSQALLRAKDAHSEFERGLGAKDYNWPLWYAAYISEVARAGGKVGIQARQPRNRSFARFRKCATA